MNKIDTNILYETNDVCVKLFPNFFFDVLLTVHLSIFISVINQLDAQKFCFTIRLFHASTCFEHMCSSSGGQNSITQPLVSSHLYHQEVKITLHSLWYNQAYRCDVTRGCVIQFWPSDDEQNCITQLWYHYTYIIWRSKLLYTASGIITPIGEMIPEAV